MECHANEPIPATHNVPATAIGNGAKQLKFKKTRRGWGSKRKKLNNLTLFGNNANGVKAKKESLLKAMQTYGNPSCILIQETKLRFPGTFRLPGYQIFEKLRTGMGDAY